MYFNPFYHVFQLFSGPIYPSIYPFSYSPNFVSSQNKAKQNKNQAEFVLLWVLGAHSLGRDALSA